MNQMTVEAQIMEGLVRFDPRRPDQQPQSNLALRHFVIDPQTYVFRLRKDVYFHPFPNHSKERLTPDDVKFSLEEAMKSGSPLADRLKDIASIDTVGNDLVKIKLHRANPSFLAVLATSIGHVTSRKYYENLGANDARRKESFNRFPIGTGPYRLVKPLTNANNTIVLERFDGYRDTYWARSRDAVTRVTFRFYDDSKAILKGIDSGDVSMANLPLTEYADGTKFDPEKGSVTLLTPPFLVILAINTAKPPLNDERVRQLLNAAVHKPKLLGICHTDTAELPPGFQYYMRIPQQYVEQSGPEKLQRLRADPAIQSALAQIRKTGLKIMVRDRPDHIVDQILESVAADLRNNLGIETHFDRVDPVWREAVDANKPDLIYIEWTPDTPWEQEDPSILQPLFESGSEYNLGGFRDQQVDHLFSRIRGIVDPGTRETIYNEIQKRLLLKAPFIWLPSVRHTTLYLKAGYEAPYASVAGDAPSSNLVHFTSMLKEIRTLR
jgi:peptide/nickel transport system substrate-binding protein